MPAGQQTTSTGQYPERLFQEPIERQGLLALPG